MKTEFIKELPTPDCFKIVYPTIKNVNDFFACVFPNMIFLPILVWTFAVSPISYLLWGEVEEIGQKTQKDGTDLFFLSTEAPTSRRRFFCKKVVCLTSLLVSLHLVIFALPLFLLLWKTNYFSNFTWLQTLLFLTCNFLIIPLFFFVPWFIFLFSLASLGSVWYTVLKWFGRLSVIIVLFLGSIVFEVFYKQKGIGKEILNWAKNFSEWLSQNYLLTTLIIMGATILLAGFTLFSAFKNYQEKDLK